MEPVGTFKDLIEVEIINTCFSDRRMGAVIDDLAKARPELLDIPVCGMVKDDNHRTRGLYYNNEELPIDTRSEAFKLITRIQDEAHRFAIEYHRSLRSKSQVKSSLDDIPGIGPARRKALMRSFKSIDEIREASIEELSAVPEIPETVAKQIYDFFHESV